MNKNKTIVKITAPESPEYKCEATVKLHGDVIYKTVFDIRDGLIFPKGLPTGEWSISFRSIPSTDIELLDISYAPATDPAPPS